MLGAVGERAGIAGELMSAQKAKETISAYLSSWIAAGLEKEQAKEERDWRDMVAGTSALQACKMLDLLHPDAKVYVSRTFELGPGHQLKPSWSLGWYLMCIDMDVDWSAKAPSKQNS